MSIHCLISFGSNLGDRDQRIAAAASRIASSDLVENSPGLATSRLFETPPIGGPGGQEPFLNAIGAFETRSSARDVLSLLHDVERELGRERRQRWDARTIDLDVVMHGELMGGGSGLIVPHPRYTARQFVLQPACDVAGHFRDPRFGWTLNQLAEHVSCGEPSLALVGGDIETRNWLCQQLTQKHKIRTFKANPVVAQMGVVANAPSGPPRRSDDSLEDGDPINVTGEPWVAAYLPKLPMLDSDETKLATYPRLIARMQRTTADSRWPAPHQMWPTSWTWPEYRLEVDDLDWAVSEIVSALDSMRCPMTPVTEDGNWW